MKLAENRFKTATRTLRPIFGIWASFPSSATVEALAHSTCDWMLIDAEHAPLGIDTLHAQLQAAGNGACLPVVRPASSDVVLVKRLLDLGVQNLMFPMIDSAEQARAAVASTRYPPAGVRGVAGAMRASRYGRIEGYMAQAHTQLSVVVQIESPQAVEASAAIAAVDGIDALFVGPNDLAARMGHPGDWKHPQVRQAIERVIEAARAQGRCVGILVSTVDDAAHYLGLGATLIACGSDVRLLTRAADELGTRLRALVGAAALPSAAGPDEAPTGY